MSGANVSAGRCFYWSVRRELWENRSIYLAPLAVASIVLAGSLIGLVALPARIRDATALGPSGLREAVEGPYVTAAIILMAVDLLVAVVYCVDALYGERRDRSVLFWKSMPVSDVTAVLAKASIPILVLPLVTFLATVVTQAVLLLAGGLVLAANGMGASVLWAHLSLGEMTRVNFVHLVGFHGLWYAPLYAWLLLVSAWATRVPFVWAVLPPAAIGVVERIAFDSTHFAELLRNHFLGSPQAARPHGTAGMSMEMLAPHSLGHFLGSPGLWIGLAIAATFLLGAVRLRRSRGAL